MLAKVLHRSSVAPTEDSSSEAKPDSFRGYRREVSGSVTVIGLKRLDRSPYNPTEDRVYWECDLVNEDLGVLEGFHVWVSGTEAVRLVRPPERWVEAKIEDLAIEHGDDLSVLSELSPVQLHPDPA
jgi:hypothetical protein